MFNMKMCVKHKTKTFKYYQLKNVEKFKMTAFVATLTNFCSFYFKIYMYLLNF